MPLAEALHVLLGLLRDAGAAAQGGGARRAVPAKPAAPGSVYHLLRVRLDDADDWCRRSAATG